MEKKVLKIIAVLSVIICGLAIGVFLFVPDLHARAVSYSKRYDVELGEERGTLTDRFTGAGEHSLYFTLPKGVGLEDVSFEADLRDSRVLITIKGTSLSYFSSYDVGGSGKNIATADFRARSKESRVELSLSEMAESSFFVEGGVLYVDVIKPSEKYRKLVIIDPRGAGSDPKAAINLSFATELAKELSGEDIGVFLTRDGEEDLSDSARVAFSDSLGADLFISLGVNSTASGRVSRVAGTEVMYHYADSSGRSKNLAEGLLTALCESLSSENRGLVAGDEEYVIRNPRAVNVLVLPGYITNEEEAARLSDEEYRRQGAAAMARVIKEYLSENSFSQQ